MLYFIIRGQQDTRAWCSSCQAQTVQHTLFANCTAQLAHSVCCLTHSVLYSTQCVLPDSNTIMVLHHGMTEPLSSVHGGWHLQTGYKHFKWSVSATLQFCTADDG